MTGFEASLTLAVGAATLAAVAAGEIPRLRMNRATMAVVGATVVVAAGLRSLDQAYAAIDADTLVLLFGMMVLNANLRLAGFFDRAAASLARHAHSPRRLLALTIAISAALSALLLNDTVALGMTPLVVAMTKSAGLSPLPFLVALATSANIGSSASLVGNPQNMIIATASGIPFLPFLVVMTPPAVAGCAFVWAVLARVYRRELLPRRVDLAPQPRSAVDRSLLAKSLAATALLAVLLVAGAPIALSALVAASLLLVTRRHAPERVFAEIDWSLLVLFAGLFVVTDAVDAALTATGSSARIEAWIGYGFWGLAGATALLSNLVSNVPAVLLLRGAVARLPHAEQSFYVLSAASTLAGNLTLLGSVANLIVAELARRDGVELSFREYLKTGVVVTVVTLAIAVAWLDVVAR